MVLIDMGLADYTCDLCGKHPPKTPPKDGGLRGIGDNKCACKPCIEKHYPDMLPSWMK
ncbi:hypothetical protein CENSYa_0807 [Cenarchaeum symbiosum A]|uniref:Uncharacterized protein n=1 Tax=Cenarchaeum symbiosum (strain A) TaxID=414004 RepID=A0RVS3_CENSY|nr:hypothetical protein CENSYa_0807 [Cenarchaeum symbiosum A]